MTTQLQASDFNLETLNAEQLAQHLTCSINAESNMFVIGRRGSGKTQIAKQAITDLGFTQVYVNLSIMERTDFGYPKLFGFDKATSKEQFVDYMLPRFFEPLICGDKKAVLLLDEADKSDTSLLAPLLEIVQNKSINGRSLTNLMSCIMTGNLISEGSQRPSLPLLDRAEKFLLNATTDVWLRWAATPQAQIHPSIFSYIQDHPSMLCGNEDIGDNYGSESPRSWHLSSNIVKFGEEHTWPLEVILEKVAGFVGKRSGLEYANYFTHYQVLLPFVNQVFDGEDVKAQYKAMGPSDKMTVCMIVAARFASKLDECDPKKDQPECIQHVGKFMALAGHENMVASMRAQVQRPRMQKWKLWTNEHWKNTVKDILDTSS